MTVYYTVIGDQTIRFDSGNPRTSRWCEQAGAVESGRLRSFHLDSPEPDLAFKVSLLATDSDAQHDEVSSPSPLGEGAATLLDRPDCRIHIDPAYRNASLAISSRATFEHAVMVVYSAYVVHHQLGVMVQASCVPSGYGVKLYIAGSKPGESTPGDSKLGESKPKESGPAPVLIRISGQEASVFVSPLHTANLSINEAASRRLYGIFRATTPKSSTTRKSSTTPKSSTASTLSAISTSSAHLTTTSAEATTRTTRTMSIPSASIASAYSSSAATASYISSDLPAFSDTHAWPTESDIAFLLRQASIYQEHDPVETAKLHAICERLAAVK